MRSLVETPEFDSRSFQSEKARFAELLTQGAIIDATGVGSVESRIALLEALGDRLGHDLSPLSQRLNSKKLRSLLKKDFSREGLEGLLSELYDLRYGKAPQEARAQALWKKIRGKTPSEMIHRRAMNLWLQNDFETALEQLGLLDSKNESALQRFKNWRKKHSNFENTLSSSALNAAAVDLLGVPAGGLPQLSKLNTRELPAAVLEKIRKEGFDAAYEDVKKLWGGAAQFDFYWAQSRKIYWVGMSFYVASYLKEALDPESETETQQGPDHSAKKPNDESPFQLGAAFEDEQIRSFIRTYHRLDPDDSWPKSDSEQTRLQLRRIGENARGQAPSEIDLSQLEARFEKILQQEKTKAGRGQPGR
jgi:hypothetical protein